MTAMFFAKGIVRFSLDLPFYLVFVHVSNTIILACKPAKLMGSTECPSTLVIMMDEVG